MCRQLFACSMLAGGISARLTARACCRTQLLAHHARAYSCRRRCSTALALRAWLCASSSRRPQYVVVRAPSFITALASLTHGGSGSPLLRKGAFILTDSSRASTSPPCRSSLRTPQCLLQTPGWSSHNSSLRRSLSTSCGSPSRRFRGGERGRRRRLLARPRDTRLLLCSVTRGASLALHRPQRTARFGRWLERFGRFYGGAVLLARTDNAGSVSFSQRPPPGRRHCHSHGWRPVPACK